MKGPRRNMGSHAVAWRSTGAPAIAANQAPRIVFPRTTESLARSILFANSVIVFLIASSMAPAQVTIDVSKITCDEFVKYEIADPKLIAIWISGYYHGLHKNPMVDKHQTLQTINELEEYCFKHPNDLVMNEVGELLGAAQ
jgi:acid stress chaperone HdeB